MGTKVNPMGRSLQGRRVTVDPIVYRIAKVNPIRFGRTNVYPLEVEELLSILQCIGEVSSILCISGELRSIIWRLES